MINKESSLSSLYLNKLKREISFEINRVGVITYIDSNAENILGYTADDLINRNLYEFISIGDDNFNMFLYGQPTNNIEIIFKHKSNNSHIYLDINYEYIIDSIDNSIVGAFGTMIDVTKYKEQEKRLQMLDKILDNSKDILYKYMVRPERKLIYVSKAAERILGHSIEDNRNDPMNIFQTVHPDDIVQLEKKMSGQIDYSKPIITRWKHIDGHYVWMEDYPNPIYNENGVFIGVEGVYRDVSERIELENKLRTLTYRDSLTGVKNRRYFDEEIEKMDEEIDISVGIIMCDIDNLKTTNDIYGHCIGDKLIKNVAKLLSKLLTDNMFIARIGGDEFAIVIKNSNEPVVVKLFYDIKKLVNKFNALSGGNVKVSLGYAFTEKSIGKTKAIYKVADRRMYDEKRKHKSKFVSKIEELKWN